MKLFFGFICLVSPSQRSETEDNFVPPEQRFDFNKMGRVLREDPANPGQGKLFSFHE